MSLIRKHVAVLQAWACLALVNPRRRWYIQFHVTVPIIIVTVSL